MTDRELLKLAAKTAHIKLADEVDSYIPASRAMWIVGPGGIDAVWNPLNDDGDALRLSVRVGISILQNIIRVETGTIKLTLAGIFIKEDFNGEWESATRRAIVRAAAAHGELP